MTSPAHDLIRPEALAAHVASRQGVVRTLRRSRATWGFVALVAAVAALGLLASTVRVTETATGYAVTDDAEVVALLPMGVHRELRTGQQVRLSDATGRALIGRLEFHGEVTEGADAAELLGDASPFAGQPAVRATVRLDDDADIARPVEVEVRLRSRSLVELFSLRRLLRPGHGA